MALAVKWLVVLTVPAASGVSVLIVMGKVGSGWAIYPRMGGGILPLFLSAPPATALDGKEK